MSDVNWDLAPKDATEIRSNGNIMRFFNKHNHLWNGAAKKWVEIPNEKDWQTIATRLQEPREEYEKAREGKVGEWTHLDPDGRKCRIIHVHDSVAWVRYENRLSNELWDADSLKPIKPQITKAEAWDMLNSGEFYNAQYGIDTLKHKHDIID